MRWIFAFLVWGSIVLVGPGSSADTVSDLWLCSVSPYGNQSEKPDADDAVAACKRVIQHHKSSNTTGDPNFSLAVRSMVDWLWGMPHAPKLDVLALANWYRTADIYRRMSKDEAMSALEEAISLNPNDEEMLIFRAGRYAVDGKNDNAIADYNAAIRVKPEDWRPYYGRGQAFAEKHVYGEAITDFEKAIALVRHLPADRQERVRRGLMSERDKAYAALGKTPPDLSSAAFGVLPNWSWQWLLAGPALIIGLTAGAAVVFKVSRYQLIRLLFSAGVAAAVVDGIWYRVIYPAYARGPQEAADWATHPYAYLIGAAIPGLVAAPLFYWWLGKAKWFNGAFAKPSQDGAQPWWEVLGLPAGATLEQAKSAYTALSDQYLPDRVAGMGKDIRDLAEKKSKKIDQAFAAAVTQFNNG